MQKVLLTGSTGFVGRKVSGRLAAAGYAVRKAVRRPGADGDLAVVGSIGPGTDWSAALDGCAAVVHLAGRTPGGAVSADEFTTVNDQGAARLAEQARQAGVETLVLMSSIFAVTENASEAVVDDRSASRAALPYGRSKLAAEAHVAAFAGEGRAGIALRPPLVYGAAATGNWALLQKLAATGLPLPFGAARNRRTMISVDNLADAVVAALRGAAPAKSGAYAVADGESLSLAEILACLCEGMGKPARLVPVPATLMATPLKLAGRGAMAQSLLGNLEVDAARFRTAFDWSPAESAREAIRRSGREFAAIRR
ncbi:MAG: NAD-dependent epimerase/dehydratase family protein [Rhizobiaceae bacterium]|nr:NAD-dependent epimerase/dehydratase family protein [Rhizobiaceae bacterium]